MVSKLPTLQCIEILSILQNCKIWKLEPSNNFRSMPIQSVLGVLTLGAPSMGAHGPRTQGPICSKSRQNEPLNERPSLGPYLPKWFSKTWTLLRVTIIGSNHYSFPLQINTMYERHKHPTLPRLFLLLNPPSPKQPLLQFTPLAQHDRSTLLDRSLWLLPKGSHVRTTVRSGPSNLDVRPRSIEPIPVFIKRPSSSIPESSGR